ncbi:thaumatin family-domain-containing protein [Mycena pura]|uniref:Thaumatin family-domain-containing protein n=1 Tax=Mycena pura TaxID=153505 RepID=A0AAD6VC99_9AGAR|nr:thaumatin family-domain-containing protein [Mycena pura]
MKYLSPLSLAMVSGVFFTASGAQPVQPPGWEAQPNSYVTFATSDNCGRRNCDFSTNPGPSSCLDGGCIGGLVCNATTGTGVPPATLATIDFSGTSQDIYTVSVVDGYNLPMAVITNAGNTCSIATSSGCKSACLVDALVGNAGKPCVQISAR